MADESTLGKQSHDGEATSIVSAFADQSLEAVAKQQAADRQRSLAGGEGTQAANRPTSAPDWDPDVPDESIEGEGGRIPPGLLIAAVAAIFLLGFGGYGVVKERSELREEITRLQAELAAPARPAGSTVETRQALRRIELRNDELRATIATLEQENRRLQTSLSEQQAAAAVTQDSSSGTVATQQSNSSPIERVAPVASAEKASTTSIAAADNVAAATPSPESAGENGAWFVNFSSYSQRASAQSWADRLAPDSGRVTVVPGVSNNKTYYRVRVVDLDSKAEASQVARQLEKEHKLSGLWVGTD